MAKGGSYRKAARTVQAECGVKYQTAQRWVTNNYQRIWALVQETTGETRHRDFPGAAASLWRREHQEADR